MIKLYQPDISTRDIEEVQKALNSSILTQGEYVERFEDSVKDYLGVKHAIAVSSGTVALHLAFEVAGGTGNVIPAFTFPAVENMATHGSDKSPSIKDVDPRTYNIDMGSFEEDIENDDYYDCVVPVHMFGQSADMGSIIAYKKAVANKYDHRLYIIEDAACALGAKYKDQFCGTFGDVGCFSFHPRKIITTGEGGMLVTNGDSMAERLRLSRNHGMRNGVVEHCWGYNYRMSEIAAALGYSQMKRIDDFIARRREIAAVYNEVFEGSELVIPPIQAKDCFHIYQSYVVRLTCKNMDAEDLSSNYSWYRDGAIVALRERGIDSTIGSYCLDDRRVEARLASELTLALPIHTKMSDDDVVRVAETLLEVLC